MDWNLKRILALPAGLGVAMALTMTVERAGHALLPAPPPPATQDPQVFAAYMASLPVSAFLMVLLAHAAGTFAGAFTARRMGGPAGSRLALVVGLVMVAGAVANLLTIPHPGWFALADIALIGGAAWLATGMGISSTIHNGAKT